MRGWAATTGGSGRSAQRRTDFPGINVAMGAPALAGIFTTPPTALNSDPKDRPRISHFRFDFDRDAPKSMPIHAPFHVWRGQTSQPAHHIWKPTLPTVRKCSCIKGASDPVFSLNDTLAWYRQVEKLSAGSTSADFVRVFPVPGMAHCGGGPATDQFDALGTLVDWVERDRLPIASLRKPARIAHGLGRTRPLCPYPQSAHYKGSGSVEDAGRASSAGGRDDSGHF